MQDNVNIATREKDLNIKYGMYNLGPEREAARGSVKYILTDMNNIRKSFIQLGFHLAEMKQNEFYKDFGYFTLEEFAEANLGMDKSNVYRYIRVYEQFAAVSKPTFTSGLSFTPPKMFLDDRWKDYSFSQLVEMCSMSDFQRSKCKPDMSIKQIREIKKTVSKNLNPEQEKVAMSPQKDKSKAFSYDYCSGLHGAAKAAYVKSREALKGAVIYIYDSNGRYVELSPAISNIWMDLLYCKEGTYVFRLGRPMEDYLVSEQPDK